MEINHKSHPYASFFEKASFVTLIATVILGLLSFAPVTFLTVAALKTFFIGLGILVSFVFFLFSKIGTKSLKVTSHPLVWVAAATILVVVLSSLFSPSIVSSFFGKDFSADTALFILVLFVSGALSLGLTRDHEKRTVNLFLAILGSFSLLALFHIVRFFAGVNFLSLGTFTSMVTTTVGSWHDFGIFAALTLVISLVSLQLLPIVNKIYRSLFITAFILASVILIVVDLQSVWITLSVTTLVFSIYKYILNRRVVHSSSKSKWISRVPVFPLIVTIVVLIFAWNPSAIGTFIDTHIIIKTGATYTEVALPTSLTMDIVGSTLKTSPILGAGPDRFVNEYLQYKPEIINATAFWQSNFSSGSSFILTTLVTEGILGFILWSAFIICFIIFGAKVLLDKKELSAGPFPRYGLAVSYFAGLLLWISVIVYVPQHAVLLLLFVITGIFMAHVVSVKGKTKIVNFVDGSLKIPAIILLWILIVATALSIIFYVKSTIAEVYFQSAVDGLNTGGALSVSSQKIQTALKFNTSDVFYQAISQMDVFAVNEIISSATSTPSQSTIGLIGGLINDGINSAHLAEKFDPTNPYNYLTEAQVSVVAAGIGVQGAYADATSSYQQALKLDPFDPSIYLDLGKLDFFEKNEAGTKNDLSAALELRPDYADALFEVGIISYTDKDYTTAVEAFTQVQQLESDYPDIQNALSLAQAAEKASAKTTVNTK